MNVYLIGLPGSGKTSLGKELAPLLNLQFTDTDDIIIQRQKSTIEDIFKEKGESYFRQLEKDLLQELAIQKNLLVATGGGMPCFFDNMQTINKSGISIFIDTPRKVIAKRLMIQQTLHRPLVNAKTEEEMAELLENRYRERISYYNKSRLIFAETNLSAEQVAKEVRPLLIS